MGIRGEDIVVSRFEFCSNAGVRSLNWQGKPVDDLTDPGGNHVCKCVCVNHRSVGGRVSSRAGLNQSHPVSVGKRGAMLVDTRVTGLMSGAMPPKTDGVFAKSRMSM